MPKSKTAPPQSFQRTSFEWNFLDSKIYLGPETKIMGVLNITPDSFSDGGLFMDPAIAEEYALRMQEEGACMIDVGGESSRPGSAPVTPQEEIKRITPILKRLLKKIKIPISVDTYKFEVARTALDLGAAVINDIYGLSYDKRNAKCIARYKAGVVLMHMQGNPQTMQTKPDYEDVASEVCDFLAKSIERALEGGIELSRIVVDPGFGFGKTAGQNLELLNVLETFNTLKRPVLVGLSRKSFVGHLLNTPVQGRLYGSLGAAACAVAKGAHILRVHDVLAHKHLAAVMDEGLHKTSIN